MSYIGNTSTTQSFTPAVDYFSGNASTTAFTLSRPVASVAQVQVTIDNVAQNPSSAYTVSSNTITFTSAPLSGTNNIYVYYTSPITQVIAPGQGTVTATSMASSTGTGAGVFQTSPTITTPTISSLSSASATALTLQSAGTTAITVDTSQNVGIGTTSPNTRIQSTVGSNGSGVVVGLRLQNVGTTAGDGAKILFTAGTSTNGAGISSTGVALDSADLRFDTGGSNERMRIASNGDVLIGTTSSNGKVTSSLPNATTSTVYTSSSVTTASTSWYHYVGQSGNGTSLTTNNIFIYGNGNIQNTNNSYGAMSDVKLKENIIDATPKLADLMQVKVRNYNLKNDQTHKQIGVIAQELEQVFPAMIEESNDKDFEGNELGTKTKAVKYSVFVPMLIKAIQELKAINDTQAETINALTARIEALENR
jgi:hypothetical protein